MELSRRDFIKLFGISIASVLLTRCKPTLPSASPNPKTAAARDRLRDCWYGFDEVARQASQPVDIKTGIDQPFAAHEFENSYAQQLSAEHRAALDELVANGEITAPVADLVQVACNAALYHVWRSNVPATCYAMSVIGPDYFSEVVDSLVKQSETLEQLATQEWIEPSTLATARSALERDMAYFALTTRESSEFYDLYNDFYQDHRYFPEFEALPLDIPPDAREAARFILHLLLTE